MRGSFGKKIWPAALLLLVALIALSFGLRKDHYLLNKNVRLIVLRIMKYKEYSLHRGLTYRVQFNSEDYRITVRSSGPSPSWREVAVFPYLDSIKPENQGFWLTIHGGKLVSYQFADNRKIVKPYVIFSFYSSKKPSLRRSLLFNESGESKAL